MCPTFFFIFYQEKAFQSIMKNAFYFIYKALFVLKLLKLLHYFPFQSTFSRFKGTYETGIIMASWIGLHKLANLSFSITQKPLCFKLSKLPAIIFIIFWDFLMFYQILFPPQVKRYVIITYKHGIKELPHELPNDLRLRILWSQEISRKCLNFIT